MIVGDIIDIREAKARLDCLWSLGVITNAEYNIDLLEKINAAREYLGRDKLKELPDGVRKSWS